MFLINAIYFKGSWTQRFDSTRDAPFSLRTGGTTTVSMMTHDSASPVRLYLGPDATVVDLPYGGGAYSMTIVLPRALTIDSLSASLTEERWNGGSRASTASRRSSTMPKFKLTYERELEAALSALGMQIGLLRRRRPAGLLRHVSGRRAGRLLHLQCQAQDVRGRLTKRARRRPR